MSSILIFSCAVLIAFAICVVWMLTELLIHLYHYFRYIRGYKFLQITVKYVPMATLCSREKLFYESSVYSPVFEETFIESQIDVTTANGFFVKEAVDIHGVPVKSYFYEGGGYVSKHIPNSAVIEKKPLKYSFVGKTLID